MKKIKKAWAIVGSEKGYNFNQFYIHCVGLGVDRNCEVLSIYPTRKQARIAKGNITDEKIVRCEINIL